MERIQVTKIEDGRYRGTNLVGPVQGFPVFGGQTMSQALFAAQDNLIPNFSLSFLSVNFFRPASTIIPIDYTVVEVHQGKTIISKRIEGFQNNKLLAVVKVCFMTDEPSDIKFQTADLKLYETVYLDFNVWIVSKKSYGDSISQQSIESFSFIQEMDKYFKISVGEPSKYKRQIKFEFRKLPENVNEFNCLATFFSDIFLLETSLLILKSENVQGKVKLVTTSQHTLHMFCAPDVFDQEFTYLVECERFCGGLALCNGYVFDSKKVHLLTASQEVVVRME